MKLIPATDLFVVPGDCRVITTNTHGAMGAGIAKDFRDRYPSEYYAYKRRCHAGYHHLGAPEMCNTPDGLRWLLFPTKDHWRDPSQYHWLHEGLQYLIDNIGEPEYVEPHWHLVFPPLGCGHGRLDFRNVLRLLERFDGHIPNPMTVIAPPGYPLQ